MRIGFNEHAFPGRVGQPASRCHLGTERLGRARAGFWRSWRSLPGACSWLNRASSRGNGAPNPMKRPPQPIPPPPRQQRKWRDCAPWDRRRRYDAATLSDKINGKAELYLAAGFERLECRRFALADDPAGWLERFVYTMRAAPGAFAVYSQQRRPQAQPLTLAADGLPGGQRSLPGRRAPTIWRSSVRRPPKPSRPG